MREDLHINKRQSGGVTDDMAGGRDKEAVAEEDSGVFVGSIRFYMTTEGSYPHWGYQDGEPGGSLVPIKLTATSLQSSI